VPACHPSFLQSTSGRSRGTMPRGGKCTISSAGRRRRAARADWTSSSMAVRCSSASGNKAISASKATRPGPIFADSRTLRCCHVAMDAMPCDR
jgi:hypothetical protein